MRRRCVRSSKKSSLTIPRCAQCGPRIRTGSTPANAVDEALAAGAETLVFITGSSKRAIEDHFDTDPELESVLQAQGKKELLDALHSILPSWATCVYIRQSAPLGLGHAVLCARPVV